MKKISKKNAMILLSFGILVIATSLIFSHFVTLTDFANGALMGIGIGLLLTALFLGNFKTAR